MPDARRRRNQVGVLWVGGLDRFAGRGRRRGRRAGGARVCVRDFERPPARDEAGSWSGLENQLFGGACVGAGIVAMSFQLLLPGHASR